MTSRYSFPRSARLARSRDFKRVFSDALKSGDDRIALLARGNGQRASRLGIIVAKRHLRRAVDRNRVKRLVRESFRLSSIRSQGLDLVVLVRARGGTMNRRALRALLDRHFETLGEGSRSC